MNLVFLREKHYPDKLKILPALWVNFYCHFWWLSNLSVVSKSMGVGLCCLGNGQGDNGCYAAHRMCLFSLDVIKDQNHQTNYNVTFSKAINPRPIM